MAILREFQCNHCGFIAESFSDLDGTNCTSKDSLILEDPCSGKLEKIISSPEMFILKGEGFYRKGVN